MATKLPIFGCLVLSAIPHALTSPISHIGTPEIGALSFTELAQQTFRRILELGFLRGILASLLVLTCLVCLLICILSGLATYLHRHDTRSRHQSENIQQNGEREKLQLYTRDEEANEDLRHLRRSRPGSRMIRYIFALPSPPTTRISSHPLPRQKAAGLPSLPSSLFRWSRTGSAPQSPSTPLRSALSKSPPPSHRFSKAQTFLFGRIRTSPSPSPKSVRWAEELQVFVLANVEMNIHPLPESETDIGLRRASSDGIDEELDVSPTLTAVAN